MHYELFEKNFKLDYESYSILEALLALNNYSFVNKKNNVNSIELVFMDDMNNEIHIRQNKNNIVASSFVGEYSSLYELDFNNKNYYAVYSNISASSIAIQDNISLKIYDQTENGFELNREINNNELTEYYEPEIYLNYGKIYFVLSTIKKKVLKKD